MKPEPVARLQVGDGRYRQRDPGAGDVDFDLGANEVEAGIVVRVGRDDSPKGDENRAKRRREAQTRTTAADYYPRSRNSDTWFQVAIFGHIQLDARLLLRSTRRCAGRP